MAAIVVDPDAVIAAAKDRLEWLRGDYGDDDVDLLTFAPLVELVERYRAELGELARARIAPCQTEGSG